MSACFGKAPEEPAKKPKQSSADKKAKAGLQMAAAPPVPVFKEKKKEQKAKSKSVPEPKPKKITKREQNKLDAAEKKRIKAEAAEPKVCPCGHTG